MTTITMIVQETSANEFTEIMQGSSILVDDVLHPWQITELWSDTDLAAIGIHRVASAELPADKLVTGYNFARNDAGVIEQVLVTQDIPPAPVTPRQIRLALSQIGLRQAVEDYVNAQDITVQDNWNWASMFERSNPLIIAAAQALGKTEADIDGLFALARSL